MLHPMRSRLGAVLAILNATFWTGSVLVAEPLPRSAFSECRPSPIETPSGAGLRFDVSSHCGPVFVLAGRDVGVPWYEDAPVAKTVIRANLPGAFAAFLTTFVAENALGSYGAMWAGTCAFALVSTGQWWAIGWALQRLAQHLAGSGKR